MDIVLASEQVSHGDSIYIDDGGSPSIPLSETAPEMVLSVTADITDPTSGSVTVTATFSDEAATRQYSFDDSTWNDYPDGGVVMDANGTVYFRGLDALGVASEVGEYTVDNIVGPDAGDTIETATDLGVVTSSYVVNDGAIDPADDLDFYKFTIVDAGFVNMETDGVSGGDTVIYLCDADSRVLGYDDNDGNGNYSQLCGNIPAGTYYVVVGGQGDAAIARYSLTVTVTTPQSLVLGITVDNPYLTANAVTVSATFNAETVERQYSLDNSTWAPYPDDGVVMNSNGTVYFRGLNAEGDPSEVVQHTVNNIAVDLGVVSSSYVVSDAAISAAGEIDGYMFTIGEAGWVTLRTDGEAGGDTVMYIFDADLNQLGYNDDISEDDRYSTMFGNLAAGSYFVLVTGKDNTVIDNYSLSVTVDSLQPEVLSIAVDNTRLTVDAVTVTATFNGVTAERQYSLDNSTWVPYPDDGVVMNSNGTVYFRGLDAGGTASEVLQYTVNNIAVDLGVVSASYVVSDAAISAAGEIDGYMFTIEEAGWVTLTTDGVSGGDTVMYIFDADQNRLGYSDDISEDNRYSAMRGNIPAGSYFVLVTGKDNTTIDNYSLSVTVEAPQSLVTGIAANITVLTANSVTVTATFNDVTAARQYSLDNSSWYVYSDSGVVMSSNGTVYFRGFNAEGTASEVAQYEVANIVGAETFEQALDLGVVTDSHTVPDAAISATGEIDGYKFTLENAGFVTLTTGGEADGDTVLHLFDADKSLLGYNDNISDGDHYSALSGNLAAGSYYVLVTGGYGDITLDNYSLSLTVISPQSQVLSVEADTGDLTVDDVTVTAVFNDATVERQYSLDKSTWNGYTDDGVVMSENGTVFFRGFNAEGTASEIVACTVNNIALDLGVVTDSRVVSDAVVAFPGEVDLYRFTLNENATVTLTTDGAAGGDTVMYIFDADQNRLGYNDDIGEDNYYSLLSGILAAGTYYVMVEGYEHAAVGSYSLSLTVEPLPAAPVDGDLNGDGRADIVMTIAQDGHPADGSTGAWLIQEDQTAAWGDLSQRNEGWSIFGTGVTTAGKTTNDVYVKSDANVVGAWVTDDTGKVAGWVTVGEFDASTNVLGLGDFNGDGQTDLLLRNDNGAVGCYFTSGDVTGWNYFQSLGDEWTVSAVGDLNGDGRDDVVLKHDAGFAGSWLTQSDYTMAWANLDTLAEGFSIVGCGDFDGDGTDDVLLQNGSYFGAWIVEDGSVKSWMGLGDLGNVTVEQIADFDADGIDDLRIRTAAGDLGAQLVRGADTLEWHYYGSVGEEWSTLDFQKISLAAV